MLAIFSLKFDPLAIGICGLKALDVRLGTKPSCAAGLNPEKGVIMGRRFLKSPRPLGMIPSSTVDRENSLISESSSSKADRDRSTDCNG